MIATAIIFVAFTVAPAAHAAFGVAAFDGQVTANAGGDPYTQAGGHPFDASTSIDFNTHVDALGLLAPDGDSKTVQVDLPPGLIGNPNATPRCDPKSFFGPAISPDGRPNGTSSGCSNDTQVGYIQIRSTLYGSVQAHEPVFSVVPPNDEVPAAFGFKFLGVPVLLNATVRSGTDFGVTVTVPNISQGLQINGNTLHLWGNPADRAHDIWRCKLIGNFDVVPGCNGDRGTDSGPNSVSYPPVPFLTLPTSCTVSGVGLRTVLKVDSWVDPGNYKEASFVSHLPPSYPASPDVWGAPQGPEGCSRVPFDPAVDVEPTTKAPDSPTGLKAKLTFPQEGLLTAGGLGTAHLRRATVTLPDGLTISPGAANGLQACSEEQVGLHTTAPPACPEASKIGTATAVTPVLKDVLNGELFIADQKSGDPESGDMFRTFLSLKGPGVRVKLLGHVRADAQTGRLTATFDDNPQLPVSTIELSFKQGPRAPLANPASCGEKVVQTALTAWSDATASPQSRFGIDCAPGLGGFAPSLQAGVDNTQAGAFAPFALSISKPDGNAAVNGLQMVLPAGLLAKLKGNLGTQVGTVKAFAGPGSQPFMLAGKVFLEGQYGDAPFSLRVVVPAKAGPFDLGEVVVRQKIYVDPITAQVTVVSDPVPTIVKGVPARLQRLEVNVDKPGFVVNPTSCAPKEIKGTLSSAAGQSVAVTNRFQVADCGALALKPQLGLTLSGKGQTRDGGHPAVSATLTQPVGGANLKKVQVALPLSLALDPDNAESDSLCSFVEGSKLDPKCPASSVVGKATAVSPILNEPLTGPVFFVKNERKDPKSGRSIKTTPKLVIPLVGENGVKLVLTGTSTVVDDQLVTTFDNIPDAPVSSFKMDITGGKKGILVISGDKVDICKSTQIADQQVDGQNTKQADSDVYIQTPSCPLTVLSKKVAAKSVTLKVSGLGAGEVTITGRGIKKTTKSIAKSTVATITAKRTKGKPGTVTVSYDPAGPAKARKTTK
jgi:hypothetical protein